MSGAKPNKRNKPLSANGRYTPVQLNSTQLASASSVGRTHQRSSVSKLFKDQSTKYLNTTINPLIGRPTIKTNLLVSNPLEDQTQECDFLYNDYLQALMKKVVVSELESKYEQEMKDQLAIQRDNLHQNKVTLKKIKQEIKTSEELEKFTKLTQTLHQTVDSFSSLNEDFDLNSTLNEVSSLLESTSKNLYLQNITPISEQGSMDKLTEFLEKYVDTLKKIDSPMRPIESIHQLGELLKTYQHLVNSLTESISELNNQQETEACKLFKSISDMYAQK